MPKAVARTRSERHHPTPNASQVWRKKQAENSRFSACFLIARGLSQPSPSATRPPQRGEKPKYTTGFQLRGTRLSPRLSLKLSLPGPRTGSERRRLRPRTDHQKVAVLFDGYEFRKSLALANFPAWAAVHFLCRSRVWDEERLQKIAVRTSSDMQRSIEPLTCWDVAACTGYQPATATYRLADNPGDAATAG